MAQLLPSKTSTCRKDRKQQLPSASLSKTRVSPLAASDSAMSLWWPGILKCWPHDVTFYGLRDPLSSSLSLLGQPCFSKSKHLNLSRDSLCSQLYAHRLTWVSCSSWVRGGLKYIATLIYRYMSRGSQLLFTGQRWLVKSKSRSWQVCSLSTTTYWR